MDVMELLNKERGSLEPFNGATTVLLSPDLWDRLLKVAGLPDHRSFDLAGIRVRVHPSLPPCHALGTRPTQPQDPEAARLFDNSTIVWSLIPEA